MNPLLLLGLVLLAAWCLLPRGGSRSAHGGGARHAVAVHEAAHVVTARRLGDASAQVWPAPGGGYRGRTDYSIDGTAVDEAVITLAGSIASRRLTGDPALRGSHDVRDARRLLAGTGVSERDARTAAARLVARNLAPIRREAARIERRSAS